MTEATVSAGYAKVLLDVAVSNGADRELLLERSDIFIDDLSNQDSRIPFVKFAKLMKAGKALCNEPALALLFGEAVDFHDFSIVGLVARSAETMGEALKQVNRYSRLVMEVDGIGASDRIKPIQDDEGLWLVDASQASNVGPGRAEATFALMISTHRRDFGDVSFLKEVHFTHSEPSYRAEYDRIFGVPIVFDSDKNALLVDHSTLTKALSPSKRYVFGILSEHADALLKELEQSKTIKGRVESCLIPILHRDDLGMSYVANELGLSRQTLYRKLKSEGISYEALLDELRHKMAVHYLNGKNVSVNEVAYLLGYNHPNAFSRAFKRWTGKSPRAFTPTFK